MFIKILQTARNQILRNSIQSLSRFYREKKKVNIDKHVTVNVYSCTVRLDVIKIFIFIQMMHN